MFKNLEEIDQHAENLKDAVLQLQENATKLVGFLISKQRHTNGNTNEIQIAVRMAVCYLMDAQTSISDMAEVFKAIDGLCEFHKEHFL